MRNKKINKATFCLLLRDRLSIKWYHLNSASLHRLSSLPEERRNTITIIVISIMIIIITKNMPILTDYFQSQLCECHCGFMVGDAPHDVWVRFCLTRHCYISRQITFCHVYIICLSVRVQAYAWFESDIVGIGGGLYVLFFHCFLTLNDCHSILSLNFQIIKCINAQSCFILSIIKQMLSLTWWRRIEF